MDLSSNKGADKVYSLHARHDNHPSIFLAQCSNEFRLTTVAACCITPHEPYRTVRIWE